MNFDPSHCQKHKNTSGKNISYRLYLVSDERVLQGRDFLKSMEQAIQGGVTVLQLRHKEGSSKAFYRRAHALKKITEEYGIPLIINDRVDIALAVKAEGVHLGQQDLPVAVARQLLGPDAIIGASTATLSEAKAAEGEGADYIGVGALFPTATKSNTRSVSLEKLKHIKDSVSIPVVAIGGLTRENIPSALATGIEGVAVVSAILAEEDIRQAAKDLRKID